MPLPDDMNAIEISTPGGPEVLRLTRRPVPRPAEGEILIRVAYAGVNRPDVSQRSGGYPPPKGASDLPGLEVSGEVVALGPGFARNTIGEKVCALTAGGGYAEYVAVHGTSALPVPVGMSMLEAAALPETFFTVWTNVFDRAGLKPGETVLIHGGTSGIGTTAIQLAKAFGSTVITTAGGAAKVEACHALGADLAIDYRSEDFVEAARAFTSGRGVDVILDMVGGAYVQRNYAVAADRGRIVQIAFLEGARVELDLRPLMMKRLVHTGSTLRPRTISEKAAIASALEQAVWPLLAAGVVKPIIHSQFALADAAKAHALMESSSHIGKIMLQVAGDA